MNEPSTCRELETELDATLQKLEQSGIPLEERLRLHNRGTELYAALDQRLAEARAELEQRTPAASEEPETETYETLSGQLEKLVEKIEAPELPLEQVLELRRQAFTLHARCERILASASGRIRNLDQPSEIPENDQVPS